MSKLLLGMMASIKPDEDAVSLHVCVPWGTLDQGESQDVGVKGDTFFKIQREEFDAKGGRHFVYLRINLLYSLAHLARLYLYTHLTIVQTVGCKTFICKQSWPCITSIYDVLREGRSLDDQPATVWILRRSSAGATVTADDAELKNLTSKRRAKTQLTRSLERRFAEEEANIEMMVVRCS